MSNVGKPRTAAEIQQDWDTNPRWKGITRDYTAAQVEELQGSVVEENTLARRGAESCGTASPRATAPTSTRWAP